MRAWRLSEKENLNCWAEHPATQLGMPTQHVQTAARESRSASLRLPRGTCLLAAPPWPGLRSAGTKGGCLDAAPCHAVEKAKAETLVTSSLCRLECTCPSSSPGKGGTEIAVFAHNGCIKVCASVSLCVMWGSCTCLKENTMKVFGTA